MSARVICTLSGDCGGTRLHDSSFFNRQSASLVLRIPCSPGKAQCLSGPSIWAGKDAGMNWEVKSGQWINLSGCGRLLIGSYHSWLVMVTCLVCIIRAPDIHDWTYWWHHPGAVVERDINTGKVGSWNRGTTCGLELLNPAMMKVPAHSSGCYLAGRRACGKSR